MSTPILADGAIFNLPVRDDGGRGPGAGHRPRHRGSVGPRSRRGGDDIYFTGTDPGTGQAGLFRVTTAGGAVATVASGAPFVSPDSVVVDGEGVAYVTDQGGGAGQGQVFKVDGGKVTPVLTGLRLGSPAGVTLVDDDATLLVSSVDDDTLADQVLFLQLGTGETATKVIGTSKSSSGGLHRSPDGSVLAWADVQRPGRVYRVEL